MVRDLDKSLARYYRLFSVEARDRLRLTEQYVEVAFLAFGDTQLELLQPLTTDSGVARFLEKRGEGLHHIGLAVDDIDVALQSLTSSDVRLIDHAPRRGVHGLIAFVHPASTGGTLIELVQHSG